MIDANDLKQIAETLIGRHGPDDAIAWADQAVAEMDALGDEHRSGAWRALRATIADLAEGRLDPAGSVVLH